MAATMSYEAIVFVTQEPHSILKESGPSYPIEFLHQLSEFHMHDMRPTQISKSLRLDQVTEVSLFIDIEVVVINEIMANQQKIRRFSHMRQIK